MIEKNAEKRAAYWGDEIRDMISEASKLYSNDLKTGLMLGAVCANLSWIAEELNVMNERYQDG